MKIYYVEKLIPGTRFEAVPFLIQKCKESKTKTGKSYWDIIFSDRTGECKGKVWENAISSCDRVENGMVASISGEVNEYNGSIQVVISEIRVLDTFDNADFIPISSHDIDSQYDRISEIIKSTKNLFLKKLLKSVFIEDNEFATLFKKAFGAEKAHHAFLGGLMEHTLEMFSFIDPIIKAYPEIDRDLLVTGILFHDIGKVFELSNELKITRTRQGHLWGHIIQGVDFINRKINLIKDFPEELRDNVIHLILSHHGQLDFGSPVKPMTFEAMALHFVDMISSKLQMVRMLKAQTSGGDFSEYSHLLDGRFYFPESTDPSEDGDTKGEHKTDHNLQILF